MATRLVEVPDGLSVTYNPLVATFRYRVVEAINEIDARAYALANTPLQYSSSFGTIHRSDLTLDRATYDVWDCTVTYGKRPIAAGSMSWSYSTTGGSMHIIQAKEHVATYPTTKPNYGGLIGVEQNDVKGVDITVPQPRLTITFNHPAGYFSKPFIKLLSDTTGKYNSTTFFGYPAGEVLFMGADASDGTDSDAQVQYQFALSANLTNVTIGAITGVTKKGWDVAWVRYIDSTQAVSGTTYHVKTPESVHVERVYDTADLASILGFG